MVPSQNMVGRFPLQMVGDLAKVVGCIFAKLAERFFCKSGRALLKKLGWGPLNPLVDHSSCKKLGQGGFSLCASGRPPRNTWASQVRPRKLKFGRRYFRQGVSGKYFPRGSWRMVIHA
ncbi:hypothetical protein Pyn_14967 [Prunus yedoensis var. nudiflora]|uniref:Uncharacterized protein n=1 Tax=Prunus yedoensis var. nudiflora TaxID=2094558 RepID=A0A314ZLI5_PRUYE|nr:hypothetical protein Pyn_14967 [Prunus yedoensis var. nudiflora]